MKSISKFGIALAALFAVVGCSKNEVLKSNESDNGIRFSTYVDRAPQSKGLITDSDNLEIHGFGVSAYYTHEDDWSENSVPNYMYNTKVSGGDWSYSPVKYWPVESEKISFFAYAPHNDANNGIVLSDVEKAGAPTLTYSLQEDCGVDIVSDVIMNRSKSDGAKVNFKFNHILSKINFTASDGVNDSNTQINIKSVVFNSVKLVKEDLYTFPTIEADTEQGSWSGANVADFNPVKGSPFAEIIAAPTPQNYGGINASDGIALLPNNGKKVSLCANDQYLFLIPGDFELKVKIEYEIITRDHNLASGYVITSGEMEGTLPVGTLTLEQGKAYAINFKITENVLSPIEFGAVVSGWDSTSSTEINF